MSNITPTKPNGWALLPIAIFLFLYLGLGITFEYILKIKMGFYNVPIVVAFLVAILVAIIQNRNLNFDQKLYLMAKSVGDKNIFTMILIFLVAGIFVGVVGRNSADSVAYFLLSIIPVRYCVAVLFLVSCFVSTAMGTSVGTITLLVPIAVSVSEVSGFSIEFCVASVIGGAMFGDNLSFISDTTIAACTSMGCKMKDKFKANFIIALPAAIVSLAIILFLSLRTNTTAIFDKPYSLIEIIPYILVFVGGIIGLNVFLVLLIGIVCGSIIMLVSSKLVLSSLLVSMGDGASSMYETIIITILVAALCGLMNEYGGFEALLLSIKKVFRGSKGGQLGMGLLVAMMNIATANNTVAIVMASPIARRMAKNYNISEKKSASILDIFSCIIQSFLPYGAQMLIAVSSVFALGYQVSSIKIMSFLFYPALLLVSMLTFILFPSKSKKH